ncbi:MAG: hypothetical protein A2831_02270 [Candidatus Yanofskybacteria bacterium RIFCSPHIGHO2_01_FULL_44_17]|uniref:LamG-like jellyroll fold domain-containing protein n=1 Tax=Candidatus Yanofskybacteria bacterium RIFCSPHIGHO2_01_FULL_44_17 TaxID=1802668 RepID=A0A1F8ETG6_9BACT|nr:MAG: hypothetical protein A2831_02270 [Candidatus Yanofskybacteria bacterium RIFCSPHIGHO2_01_FULL_44_17]
MTKKSFYIVLVVAVAFAFSNMVNVALPTNAAGSLSGPLGAFYVLTQPDIHLPNGVLTTELNTDLISLSGKNIGSMTNPWSNVYGVFGRFTNIVTDNIFSDGPLIVGSGGVNQDVAINPSGTGTVNIGGDSLVVASKTSEPANPKTGQIYFDATLGKFRGYNGTSWVDLSMVGPTPTPSPGPLADGLESYWKLDGNGNDSVGANDLILNNSPAFVGGKVSDGIDLEADSNQYLSKSDNSSLSITGDMSLSFWVKLESQPVSNFYEALIGKYTGNGEQRSWNVYYSNVSGVKKITAAFVSSGDGNTGTGGYFDQTLDNGTWYHVVVVFNISTPNVELYVNGLSVGMLGGSATSIFDGTAPFLIGAVAGDTLNVATTDGVIDEVGLWSRALMGIEVAELYNNGNGFPFPF